MFTGIIEKIGRIARVESKMERLFLKIEVLDFTNDIIPGSSISVDGVCLTVTKFNKNNFEVDAVKETLTKTTLNSFKMGKNVNLEKALKLSGRLDGHLVQGHVDGTGILTRKQAYSGNVLLTFRLSQDLVNGVVKKGSIAIDGISLTVVDVSGINITVTIVPFSLKHTTLGEKKIGDKVNIETDIIGKYISQYSGITKNR